MKTPAEKCAERIKAECLYVVGCEPDMHVDWAAAIIQSEYAPAIQAAREAMEAALGVLEEPGMMDVDEWRRAWKRRTETQLRTALEQLK